MRTKNIREGKGVYVLMLMWANIVGKWPFLAPTNNMRDEVIMWTLRPPNAETATNTGIIHANFPITVFPKV